MKTPLPLILLAGLAAAPAAAQAPEPPEHESRVIVYGDDPCPDAGGGGEEEEIVICARRPEEERYRIPPALRERRDRPLETSWGARSEMLEEASRTERPGSCSVVGSGGQTGCAAAAARQWYYERRGRR